MQKNYLFLVDDAFKELGMNVFWSVLFFGFIIVSVDIFCIIYMYTSFFALVLYPLCILLGPIIVIVAAYSLYLLVRIMKERKQMAYPHK